MEEIEKFKNDKFIQKYGAKAHFCFKNNIFQSNLSKFLKDGKNKNIEKYVQEYNAKTDQEKIEFFKDFKEEKKEKKKRNIKVKNPLLTIDEKDELKLGEEFNKKLRYF